MKTINAVGLVLLLNISFSGYGQQTATVPSPTPYSVVQRAADSRVWESTNYDLISSNEVVPHIHRYVELATGLCYQNEQGQWLDSQEEINILPDGTASATNGQHQVYFPIDIYEGTITLITPDGLQMQSRPVGLCYDDGTNIALIAALTNSIGSLVTNNQVIYPDAFMGADLRYTYRLSGFEQEIVLKQQLPPPEDFGLDSANVNLEMVTEFFSPPEPTQSASVAGPNGLSDSTLSFGSMKMVRGKAFSIDNSSLTNSEPAGIRVYKSWERDGNQSFLAEALPYRSIVSDLSRLPTFFGTVAARQPIHKTSFAGILPPIHPTLADMRPKRMAARPWHYQSGVVLDYQAIDSDETNFTFQGDTTYLITGPIYLYGTTTIEGGTVVKYMVTTNAPDLILCGLVNCETAPYRKAIFTAYSDNSVGETISGSGGNPTGYYADWALVCDNQSPPYSVTLENLEINYSTLALYMASGSSNVIRDVQLINDRIGLYCAWTTNYLENALIYSTTNNDTCIFEDSSYTLAENMTADGGNGLWVDYTNSSSLAATNCVFNDLGQLDNPFPGAYNYTNTSATNLFQIVGGGSHYLATNSTLRCAGTPNIDPALLADLALKTTWPPIVYSNANINTNLTLGPAVPRDTNSSPDIGYHYDVLDYAFGGCNLSSNLMFTAGTAVGWFENTNTAGYSQPYGISMERGASLSFDGNATEPDYFSRYAMVQEGENSNWTNAGSVGEGGIEPFAAGILYYQSVGALSAPLSAQFTKWTSDNTGEYTLTGTGGIGVNSIGAFNSCEFYNCAMNTGDTLQDAYFTNCLFFRMYTFILKSGLTLENCTFYNGILLYYRLPVVGTVDYMLVENNSFDGTAFVPDDYLDGDPAYTLFNYNAYNTNNLSWQTYPSYEGYGVLETNGANTIIVTNYNWQTSWFGDFYLPPDSPLIQQGSTNANLLGLYWFTTQTNQAIESNNVVDIGYHYVATDINGNPLNTYVSGVPNYILYPNGPPTNYLAITAEPADQTNAMEGTNVTFSVTAVGFPAPSYQWYWDGGPLTDEGGISGSASATLDLNGVNPDQTGYYYAVVANSSGSITSTSAVLNVVQTQTNYTFPLYILTPYTYWDVTDISDPAQPVNIGELPGPFSEPGYGLSPQCSTLWHWTNAPITEAYGTTTYGGSNGLGMVFCIGLTGSGITNIHSFSGYDGEYPYSQLAISGSTFYGISNTLYGTTFKGGTNGFGTVFKLNTDGTGFADLYEFEGATDGKYPQTGLLIDGNVLYGTTTNSIFKINTDGNNFTCLTNVNGASQLILSLSGNTLFGVTFGEGMCQHGMLFSINIDGSGLTDLHDFTGGTNGMFPASGLEIYGCSNLFNNSSTVSIIYGTTARGGSNDCGMVFSINSDGSGFEDLHDFNGATDGAYPLGGLLVSNVVPENSPGYLVGTTSSGGTNGGGTLFCMNLDGSGFQALCDFGGTNGSQPNGIEPVGKLASTAQAMYGVTYSGGTSNYGTVFSIDYNGNLSYLYNFGGGTNGGSPSAGLTIPVADNAMSIWSLDTTLNVPINPTNRFSYSVAIDDFYGLFVNGNYISSIGEHGDAGWTPFSSLPYLHQGENDIRVIIAGNDDFNDYFAMAIQSAYNTVFTNIFGTTYNGGLNSYGTVFEIFPEGNEANLYSFSNEPDGNNPIGDLVLSGNTLYGVTQFGGTNANGNSSGDGTLFSYAFGSTTDEIFHAFGTVPNDGYYPQAGLILAGSNLYGTAKEGGSNNDNDGIIFSINTNGSGYTILHSFSGTDGANPEARLLLVGTNLFGTTYSDGAPNQNSGTIFSICTNGSNYQTLYFFNPAPDGANPAGGLIFSSNVLYGTTSAGGNNNYGTVFSFGIGSSSDTILYQPTNASGLVNPEAGVTLSGTTLYGTTYQGGTNGGAGTVFSMDTDGNNFTILLSFGGTNSNNGQNPDAGLIIQNGLLYGTTEYGGVNTYGMVFSLNADGTGFNDIYDFMNNPDGAHPEGGVCSP